MISPEQEARLQAWLSGEGDPADEQALRDEASRNPELAALMAQFDRQQEMLTRYFGAVAQAALRSPRPELPDRRERHGRSRLAWPVYAVAGAFALILTAGIVLFSYHGVRLAVSEREVGVALIVEGSVMYFTDDGLRLVKDGMPITSKMRVKIPAHSYLSVRLHVPDPEKANNVVELRSNSIAVFQDYRDQTVLRLEQGETWVHLNQPPEKPFMVKTREYLIRHQGTIFNVVQGMTGTAVGVMQGSVVFEEGGEPVTLEAFGTHTSFEDGGAYMLAGHIPWSRYRDKLLAMLPHDLQPSPAAAPAPLQAAQARPAPEPTPEAKPSPAPVENLGSLEPIEFLPVNTRLFIDVADVAEVVADWRASDYSRLMDDPQLREWWAGDAMADARRWVNEQAGLPRWIALIGSVSGRLSAGVAHDGSVVLIGDCRNNVEQIRGLLEADIEPLLERWSALSGGRSRKSFQALVKRGYLVIGIQNERRSGLAQTLAAIEQDAPTGFTDTPFYRKITRNAPDSRLTLAFDFQSTFQAIQSRGDNDTKTFLTRSGFDKLDFVLASPDFVNAGINQAFRIGFTGGRTGVLGWLDEPAPMSSLRLFSRDTHAVVAARIKRPQDVIQDVLRWQMEDRRHPAPDIEQRAADLIRQMAACLGNEAAVGLQNPVLPLPNIQVAVEALDPERFHTLFVDCVNLLNSSDEMRAGIVLEETSYRNRRIVTISHPDMPFDLSWVVLDDFIVFGPGRPLLQITVDVFEDRQSLADQQSFQDLLPETGRMNFSMLVFQDLTRAAPALLNHLRQQALTGRQQAFVSNVDFLNRFARAGISYALAGDDHVDFFINGSRGVDLNLGGTVPFVAAFVTPRLFQQDLEHQILAARKSLEAVSVALEAYKVDNGRYPDALEQLLGPVRYLQDIPADPFAPDHSPIQYFLNQAGLTYVIHSIGPDEKDDLGLLEFDAARGLRSKGDILYTNDPQWSARLERSRNATE
ncbi:MAG: hypothetical protein Kow0059_11230 [Candidatus Sumerlaeia bacterium]